MGKGIKVFAIIIMVIGMLTCATFAIITYSKYRSDKPFISFVEGYEEYGENPVFSKDRVERGYLAKAEFTAFIYYLCGFFASLFFGLPLYWFGCLFVKVERIERSLQSPTQYESR